eukprot:658123-Rhodomonas_salina.2
MGNALNHESGESPDSLVDFPLDCAGCVLVFALARGRLFFRCTSWLFRVGVTSCVELQILRIRQVFKL